MPIEVSPMKSVQIDYKCDYCGSGYMRPTGIMLTSYPPQFPHRCNKCGVSMTFVEEYPIARYVADELETVTQEQFDAAIDITPGLTVKTMVFDGKTLDVTLSWDTDGLRLAHGQAKYVDYQGREWLVGAQAYVDTSQGQYLIGSQGGGLMKRRIK